MSLKEIPATNVGYPMPVAVLGVEHQGRPTFMAVAWFSRVNYTPPMMAVAVGQGHVTWQAIRTARVFSLSFPSAEQVVETDYVGITSARQADKSSVFPAFTGRLPQAPMAANCPVTMECRLERTVDLPSNSLFIGTIEGVYAAGECITNSHLDLGPAHPFLLTMPDNRYWGLGEVVGRAWSDGRRFPEETPE